VLSHVISCHQASSVLKKRFQKVSLGPGWETGGAAYGTPRKTVTERSRPGMPCTGPDSVGTG
jgi:hypothetical protein